jgi:hypothetical protein
MEMEVCDVGRKKRLAELTNVSRRARFGSVQPISGSDFVREVSQAPPDVWVIVHLYKDGLDFLLHITFHSGMCTLKGSLYYKGGCGCGCSFSCSCA